MGNASPQSSQRRSPLRSRAFKNDLQAERGLCIDDVVLAMPPADDVARWNHCIESEHFIWRKPGETALPELAGANDYPNQVTIDRAVPFWGGISPGGCGPIVFRTGKKCTTDGWVTAVRNGTLGALLRNLNPSLKNRPWRVLCDGEQFLDSKAATKIHGRHSIS